MIKQNLLEGSFLGRQVRSYSSEGPSGVSSVRSEVSLKRLYHYENAVPPSFPEGLGLSLRRKEGGRRTHISINDENRGEIAIHV